MLKIKWSLRQQILSPLVLASILFFFWFADRVTTRRQWGLDTAEDGTVLAIAGDLADVPPNELSIRFAQLKAKFPGWEFAALEGPRLIATTISVSARDEHLLSVLPSRAPDMPGRDYRTTFEGAMYQVRRWYWMTKFEGTGKLEGLDIVLLYSALYAESLDKLVDRQDEMVAGSLTLVLVLIAIWYSGRLSRRITQIQRQVRRIAAGQTHETVDERGHDEISDLAHSVNLMATDLGRMKQRVADAERVRLHAQLGRGIAHELRNGIHSARLALEIFREDDPVAGSSSLLVNSYDQLSMTELLVRRLLAVGQAPSRELTARPIRQVLEDSIRLVDPMFRHTEVDLTCEISDDLDGVIVEDSESMLSAIINLCLNALEAAGRHGDALIHAAVHAQEVEIVVSDSGPGPAPSVADSIFEPFVTTKPEGVGLGLSLVRQAVKDAGGSVGWNRTDGRTIFWIKLPRVAESRDEGMHLPLLQGAFYQAEE